MKMKLNEAVKIFPFTVVRDGQFERLGFVSYDIKAMLVYLESDKYIERLLNNPGITCVITKKDLAHYIPEKMGIALAENPRKAFYTLHNLLAGQTEFYGTKSDSKISGKARIHRTAYIADKDVQIADGVVIEPNVTILERVIIERDVIIRAGAIIGSEGFEFNLMGSEMMSVAHAGGVLLHSGVEVQSNSCIDKAVFGGFTEIGEDSKIDNMVHIGHNVHIGKRCRIAALAMLGGSTTLGDEVWVGPSACISSEIKIGDRANITLGSVVTKDVASGQKVSGNFAIDHKKFIEFIKSIR